MIEEIPVRGATAIVFAIHEHDVVGNSGEGVATARRLRLDIDVAVVNLRPGPRIGLLANMEVGIGIHCRPVQFPNVTAIRGPKTVDIENFPILDLRIFVELAVKCVPVGG